MKDSNPRVLIFNNGGKKICINFDRFVSFRYEGSFISERRKEKAESGLWYAIASGTGLGIEGEGHTPEESIKDLKYRAQAMVNEINSVYGL